MRENNDEKKVVEFGYYSSSADIGNHERYLKKLESLIVLFNHCELHFYLQKELQLFIIMIKNKF